MIHRLSLTAEQSILLDTISLPSAIQAHTCLTTPYCDFHSKYRTLDGSCNDPYNPNLGRAFTDYRRLARPAYADGISRGGTE